MESLPLLPGYVFSSAEPMPKDHKLKQKLKYSKGFAVLRDNFDPEEFCRDAKFVEFDPTLTYGRSNKRTQHQERFLPHYAIYARKCLSFDAYFKQGIFGSPDEHYRVRKVKIIYYLEDDTMGVMEPPVENAGFKQGKLVRRHKIPRPDRDDRFYHWKDLNVAMNLQIYGIVYRVVNCDSFTREFLLSQGIDVGEPESLPPDPYLQNRNERDTIISNCTGKDTNDRLADDSRYRFLEYDGMVLTFDAIWNNEPYKVRYFLADDTISVCEVKKPNDGKDSHNSLLLKRTKVPKNWKDVPADFPGICMERSDAEVREYYSPSDFKIGETIFIFGRRFLIYDCDSFTRRYYSSMLHYDQPTKLSIPNLENQSNCNSPSYPKKCTLTNEDEGKDKDLIRKLYNFPKKLRYSLSMDAVHPEDFDREFILEYALADGAIRINELIKRNSGRSGGCFLGWTRVPKFKDNDRYYNPEDFKIGSKICIFGHWFVITGTELFVYKYMKENPQKFDADLVKNIEDYLRCKGIIEGMENCDVKVDGENENEQVDDGNKVTWAENC